MSGDRPDFGRSNGAVAWVVPTSAAGRAGPTGIEGAEFWPIDDPDNTDTGGRAMNPPPSASGGARARFGERTLIWTDGLADDGPGTNGLGDDGVRTDRGGTGGLGDDGRAVLRGVPHLVTQVGATFNAAHPEVRVILDKGRHQVIDCTIEEAAALADPDGLCWKVERLEPDTVVVATAPPRRDRPTDRSILTLTEGVSVDHYEGLVEQLVSPHTRHSLSSGFGEAAEWARQLFQGWGYTVALTTVAVGAGESRNVVARRSGTRFAGRGEVLVTAHLDSINLGGGPAAAAPGADDNASGAAGVLEIARLLGSGSLGAAGLDHEHDLTLILFGGEEQGLHGSKQYLQQLSGAQRDRIRGLINMDMVATRNTTSPTVLLEGAAVSTSLMDLLAAAAGAHTGLVVETSLQPFASDHVPFIEAGVPAVLTIEGSDSANTNVHTAADVVDHLDYQLAAEIVRMNLAATAQLLELSPVPVPAGPSVSGPAVSWSPGRLDVFTIGPDSQLLHKWYGPRRGG